MAVGAFRVVTEEDLARPAADGPRAREDEAGIDRLRDSGLVQTVAIDGGDQCAVALTNDNRELLEAVIARSSRAQSLPPSPLHGGDSAGARYGGELYIQIAWPSTARMRCTYFSPMLSTSSSCWSVAFAKSRTSLYPAAFRRWIRSADSP